MSKLSNSSNINKLEFEKRVKKHLDLISTQNKKIKLDTLNEPEEITYDPTLVKNEYDGSSADEPENNTIGEQITEYLLIEKIKDELDIGEELPYYTNIIEGPDDSTEDYNSNAEETNPSIADRLEALENKVTSLEGQLARACKLLLEKMNKLPNELMLSMRRGMETTNMINMQDDMFPISSPDGLEEFENKLRDDPDFKATVIQKLSMLGGSDGVKAARAMAHFLFKDECLQFYSWAGKTGKLSFVNFKEINFTIVLAVRKLHPFTEHDNCKFFQEHLKHATSRLARKKRGTVNNRNLDSPVPT